MIRIHHVLAVSIVGALSFAAARPLLTQDMGMPQPTAEHTMLQKGVGQWKGTITMFMPGMPETPSAATETVSSAGPFWTLSEFKCDFMGMPYEGHGAMGFDPEQGKFVGTWLDNMSSYLSVMEGEYDAAKNMLVTRWNAPDMMGAMQPHRAENVIRDDAYTMTFYTAGTKSMVIEMKRAGKKPTEAGASR